MHRLAFSLVLLGPASPHPAPALGPGPARDDAEAAGMQGVSWRRTPPL